MSALARRQKDETELADNYLDVAQLGREVAGLALQQALRDAKAGNLRDPAKTAVSAITASGIALDKRLVLEGRPTQIHAVDPSMALNTLARKLGLSNAIDATATEIPASETAQLESPASTARESAAKTRAPE